jgi:hypothetical protein
VKAAGGERGKQSDERRGKTADSGAPEASGKIEHCYDFYGL